jgi:hypothetical protein
MKKILLFILPLFSTLLFSQYSNPGLCNHHSGDFGSAMTYPFPGENPKNVLKTSLVPMVLLNFSLIYERVLNEKLSVNTGISIMPWRTIPFRNYIETDNLTTESLIWGTRFWGISVTPELRFYPFGKKSIPEGFYLGPKFVYKSYKGESDFLFRTHITHANGSLSQMGGGMIMGYQWLLGGRFAIDLNFFGLGLNRYMTKVNIASKTFDEDVVEDMENDMHLDSIYGYGKFETTNNGKSLDIKNILILPATFFNFTVGYAF